MKKSVRLFILFVFFALFMGLSIIYFSKVKYFEPISISITGLSDSEFEKAQVLVVTPLGKEILLKKNTDKKYFSTEGIGIFIENIFRSLPEKAKNKIFTINIKHGLEEIFFTSSSINHYLDVKSSKLSSNVIKYRLRYVYKANIIQKIESFSLWRRESKIEVLTLAVFSILIFLIISLLFYHFSFIRRKGVKLNLCNYTAGVARLNFAISFIV